MKAEPEESSPAEKVSISIFCVLMGLATIVLFSLASSFLNAFSFSSPLCLSPLLSSGTGKRENPKHSFS